MSVRCKFRCRSIEPNGTNSDGQSSMRVVLDTQWEPKIPEDERFTKWTPQGELSVVIDNPKALEQLKVGGMYYLDLTQTE